MSKETDEISVRLGSAFSVIAKQFLPAVTEALERVENDKEISFGCSVKMKLEAGIVSCRIISHEPKIPTPTIEPQHFLLQRNDEGQLSFLFSGSLKEMRVELANRDVKPEDDGYAPGDNVG